MNALARLHDARASAAHLARLLAAEHGAMADFLLARETKRREARTHRPRSASARRPDPAKGQAWPLDGGGTCGSTHRLELDPVIPVARGGPSTPANLRILCEGHDKEAARRAFGTRWLARRLALVDEPERA